MAKCKFCGKEIFWMKEGKKNVPVEMDGAAHECKEWQDTVGSIRVLDKNSIDNDIIKQYEQQINQQKKRKKK